MTQHFKPGDEVEIGDFRDEEGWVENMDRFIGCKGYIRGAHHRPSWYFVECLGGIWVYHGDWLTLMNDSRIPLKTPYETEHEKYCGWKEGTRCLIYRTITPADPAGAPKFPSFLLFKHGKITQVTSEYVEIKIGEEHWEVPYFVLRKF